MPYDTFVKWQLAGDEYEPDNPLALAATGFLAAGVHSTQITKNEVEKHRYDEMDDMLATTGTAMLGLTIGCARCHDHKYDPIPQRDYYRMLSTFTTTVRSEPEIDLDPAGYKKAKEQFDKEHDAVRRGARATSSASNCRRGWRLGKRPGAGLRSVCVVEIRIAGAATADRRDSWLPSEEARIAAVGGVALLVSHDRLRVAEAQSPIARSSAKARRSRGPSKMLVASEGLPPIRLYSRRETTFSRRRTSSAAAM